jgi:PST family polysaccharide transporter
VSIGRSSIAVSARWSLVGLVSKQFARIAFSVLLARLLGPTNFGIVGQATIYLAFSAVFLNIGLASALIQRKQIDDETIGTATVLNFGAVVILIGLTQAVAGLWADLFDTPALEAVLRVLSLDFILIGFAVIPTALMTRRLNFRLLAIGEVAGTIVGGVLGLLAAILGAQYWALVVQTLATDLVYAVIVLVACGRPILAWSRTALRAILGFSTRVFGSEVLRFFSQNADNTLVALRLGPAALANYALSYRVLLLPVQILSQTANRLVFPVFSRMNDQPHLQAEQFLKVSASLSLAVAPPMLLVALSAPLGVPLVFGPEWDPAIRPMQILAIVSMISAVVGTCGGVMLAKGRADWALRWAILTTVALIGGFIVGLHWGINGVAWSYLLVGTPLAAVEIGFIQRLIPYTWTGYLRAIAPAMVAGATMVVVWIAVEVGLRPHSGDGVRIIVASLASGLAFGAVLRLFWPKVLREQLDFLKLMLTRGLAVEPQ